MGRKKPFIGKDEGVKFYLVNRSQKDPLYLDENLGEHVLVPADDNARQDLVEAINGLNINSKTDVNKKELKQKRLKEQEKFGVYFEDDYNYLQHLKEVDRSELDGEDEEADMVKIGNVLIRNSEEEKRSNLKLPASVFASNYEEEVGYFNQAAPDNDPKIHWDPDVVKILDEDNDIDFEDTDNFLEDDFFIKANHDGPTKAKNLQNKSLNIDEGDYEEDYDEEFDSDEAENDFDDDFSENQSEFETKSRFSEYSMTSSVIRRNDKLRQLDDQFESIFAQYDEDQIGGLDMEDIDGYRNTNDAVLESALEEFNQSIKKKLYEAPKRVKQKAKLDSVEEEKNEEENNEDDDTECDDKTECGSSDECTDEENDKAKKNYELVRFKAKRDKEDRLDCESILSTYSTIYNHPTTISEKKPMIELSKKSGLPLGVLTEKPLTKKAMDKIEHKITRILPEVPERNKDETKEEKKARKQMVKEHRRERRVEKKINKQAFKQEEKIQIAQMKNHNLNKIKLPL